MGGSDVRVPDGLNVEVSDFAFMGGNDAKVGEMHAGSRRADDAIRMISIMGGSDVQRGRKLSRAERKALKHSEHSGTGRSSARGTSSAVIGPIAKRSVVPGWRSPRASRVVARRRGEPEQPVGVVGGVQAQRAAGVGAAEPPAGGDQLRRRARAPSASA